MSQMWKCCWRLGRMCSRGLNVWQGWSSRMSWVQGPGQISPVNAVPNSRSFVYENGCCSVRKVTEQHRYFPLNTAKRVINTKQLNVITLWLSLTHDSDFRLDLGEDEEQQNLPTVSPSDPTNRHKIWLFSSQKMNTKWKQQTFDVKFQPQVSPLHDEVQFRIVGGGLGGLAGLSNASPNGVGGAPSIGLTDDDLTGGTDNISHANYRQAVMDVCSPGKLIKELQDMGVPASPNIFL